MALEIMVRTPCPQNLTRRKPLVRTTKATWPRAGWAGGMESISAAPTLISRVDARYQRVSAMQELATTIILRAPWRS